MVSGWRRAFYTTKDRDTNSKTLLIENHFNLDNINANPQNNSSNLTFSSTPPPSPNLRCHISDSDSSSPPDNKNNNNSPKLSSPNSPSSYYSLLKATLRLSKSLCGICKENVKSGEGKAIFTSECSHTFHFPCIAAHVKNQQFVTCPICRTNWNNLQPEKKTAEENNKNNVKTTTSLKLQSYNDDEPLVSSTSVSRFNTIPESNENEEEDEEENKEPVEFQRFDAFLLPETVLVASNKSFESLIAVLKVKVKPYNVTANRPPVDLVTVLDIGSSISAEDLLLLKRSMQVVISTLGSSDRLSVVTTAGGSKRLFSLRRMTGRGRRSTRRIVETLTVDGDEVPAKKEAMKKAAKILEDRRQKNHVAKIILLTNSYEDRRLSSTRFTHLSFPVHALNYSNAFHDGAFSKRLNNLLNVVAQDIKFELQNAVTGDIAAVYLPESNFTAKITPDSATLEDLTAEEERELLVELKVPSARARGSHSHTLSVRFSYCDPFTQEIVNSKERSIFVPRPVTVGLLDHKIKRLITLHVRARAKQLSPEMAHEWLRRLEAEETEPKSHKLRRNNNCLEQKIEPLTPISAWKAAEKLAKVAIMRKSMNKVSDLHGFEDARF